MRKTVIFFLGLILLTSVVLAQDYKIDFLINDYDNLLTQSQIDTITPVMQEIFDSGTAQYSIVIIPSLNGEDIEGFSHRLAEGHLGDVQKNNGLLLLIAVDDRKFRFEVGRGLEPVLPDVIVTRIGRDYLTPNFKDGNYEKGIYDASTAIKSILLNESDITVAKTDSSPAIDEKAIIMIFIVVIIFMVIIALAANANNNGRNNDEYFTAAYLASTLLRGGGKGGGGFGGSGGFGGGGFGGGSFGGGGGGGGW